MQTYDKKQADAKAAQPEAADRTAGGISNSGLLSLYGMDSPSTGNLDDVYDSILQRLPGSDSMAGLQRGMSAYYDRSRQTARPRTLDAASRGRYSQRFGPAAGGVKLFENPALEAVGEKGFAQGDEVHVAPSVFASSGELHSVMDHEMTHIAQQNTGAATGHGLLLNQQMEQAADTGSGSYITAPALMPAAAAPAQGRNVFTRIKHYFDKKNRGKETAENLFNQGFHGDILRAGFGVDPKKRAGDSAKSNDEIMHRWFQRTGANNNGLEERTGKERLNELTGQSIQENQRYQTQAYKETAQGLQSSMNRFEYQRARYEEARENNDIQTQQSTLALMQKTLSDMKMLTITSQNKHPMDAGVQELAAKVQQEITTYGEDTDPAHRNWAM